MGKTYINKMVAGNSGMLACIDKDGELVRLFWPDIDFPQHIERFLVGIVCPERWQGASWLCGREGNGTEGQGSCPTSGAAGHVPEPGTWQTSQYYITDTNIAVTEFINETAGLKIVQKDFALPDWDVFTRYYEIFNMYTTPLTLGFTVYSASISTMPDTAGVMFLQDPPALMHYRHGYYYAIASDRKPAQYQLGGNALENAQRCDLKGNDTIGMMKEGSLAWQPETLAAGGRTSFSLRICFARDSRDLNRLLRKVTGNDPAADLKATEAYWLAYLGRARQIRTGQGKIDELYKRSLLVFALMTNKRTGALLAAPEIDEGFTKCGRYAYCWGRDAAFVTGAMDKCGLTEQSEAFYRWAAAVQDENGGWQQRYYMDGNLAPSWGLQIDEGGSIIWGILRHYKAAGNIDFLKEMWPAVAKGVEFLLSYTDDETGLPWLSFDLWEERLGEHAYSTAAVCAGIEAGAEIADILGESDMPVPGELRTISEKWRASAGKLREALEKNFWKPEWNRFVRSIRVKLNGWGEEHTDEKVWLKQNGFGMAGDYSLLDGTIDISLLGLTVPFGMYAADDPRMRSTAEAVERRLTVEKTGGLMRYEYDGYVGGNPWILTTLWAALYHIEIRSYGRAREYLEWAVRGATEQGLLPEQIGKETGRPVWVIPLTWSHAMFVLVLDGLIAAGEI